MTHAASRSAAESAAIGVVEKSQTRRPASAAGTAEAFVLPLVLLALGLPLLSSLLLRVRLAVAVVSAIGKRLFEGLVPFSEAAAAAAALLLLLLTFALPAPPRPPPRATTELLLLFVLTAVLLLLALIIAWL